MTPAYASVLPKIVASSSAPAIQTAPGAHNYRIVGVEFTVASGLLINYGIVLLGDGSSAQNALSQVPYALVLDRVYIHGLTTAEVARGVALNSGSAAVIDSYISEIHESGADAQAILGWNGPGPFKIANNYLEASGENVMFGGADPWIANLVPADIEIRGNYVAKPVAWRASSWSVKNLFELKNAHRVLIDGNVFEYNWLAAQNGFAILFTPRNQDGTAPWSVVEDVAFTHNIVRHVASGVNILGHDDLNPSQQTKRILLKDNLFDDVSATWGGAGRLFQVLSGTADVTMDHNTAFQTENVVMADGTPANSGFVYRNNLSPHNLYGVFGSGVGVGTVALNAYFPGAIFARNILAGGNPADYPADNFFPATLALVGFIDLVGGNYKLQTTSAYKNAGTDGKDIGADIDALNAATATSVSGIGSTFVASPASLNAAGTPAATVSLSWSPVTGTTYEIARSLGGGIFAIVATSPTNSFEDTTVTAGTAYLYKVRAVNTSGQRSPFSSPDLATTVTFSDDPLVAQSTIVKAAHIMELRTAINAVRALAGLSPTMFTDAVLSGVVVQATHVYELRNALDPALSNLGLAAVSYTDLSLTNIPIKAAHLNELRAAVR